MQFNNIKKTVIDPSTFNLLGTKILVWLHQVVKLDKTGGGEKKTTGGIILPSTSSYELDRIYQTAEGIIIKHGPDVKTTALKEPCKVRVIFDDYCGCPIMGIDDFHYKIIDESEILGFDKIENK